jgi:D-alanine-D-alanine ligase
MKNVLIFFGGASPEHEVSVITGLQVFENIDRNQYNPIPIYVSPKGKFLKLNSIKNRKDFSINSKSDVFFGFEEKTQKAYFFSKNSNKKYIYSAVNTLHGGNGESGQMAGFFESNFIPYTSSNVESSVICMNKTFSKKTVSENGIPVLKSLSFLSTEIRDNIKNIVSNIIKEIGIPIIIKPAHLGSSIGIKIAKTPIGLELGLLEASYLDTEIMVEEYLQDILEFNCSVRKIKGKIIVSEIEKPISKEDILSFSEKYEKGGKKVTGGMASLSRELPANIPTEKYKEIQNFSSKIYKICKCKGVVRIDFIQSNTGDIFFNEINPIPGSMAFYLWEVMGIPFRQQLSELIEESVHEYKVSKTINYIHKTDIIKNFIKGYKY